jgi:diguanylate cyclase (GGDEF)-like protein
MDLGNWSKRPMRILVADDEPRVIAAYKVCLDQTDTGSSSELDTMGAALFGDLPSQNEALLANECRVDYVNQGQAAIDAIRTAITIGDPYSVLFLDMRMPPGIDGKEAAKQIRLIDQNVNIVIVTGYSDHSPMEVAKVAGPLDKLYYLAKPFETAEIHQLSQSLSAKWTMEEELKQAYATLAQKNSQLEEAHIEISASEARCRHIALHDQLTRLPNRLSFQESLNTALSNKQAEVAVLFVDLDRFKMINDTLGHSAGDELIARLGEKMARLLPEGAIIARLGGDEFGIVLGGTSEEDGVRIGKQLVLVCAEQLVLFGTQVQVSASIGIAFRGDSNSDGSELLRRADLALYQAKKAGRGVLAEFEPSIDESARKRAEIDSRLRVAIDHDVLTLAYQPIINPVDGEPMGYEALLRWDDPEFGSISPSIFVPIAEETGLVVKLGEWVIHKAVTDCATWPSGVVSINLSTRHFQSHSLVDFVVGEARKANLPIDRIQLEITETALFDDAQLAAEILVELRKAGLRIALDDFGTGYSSLVNLKDFEIDCIKIDQSFVATLGEDHQTSAIVQSVTNLARSLGLSVVAEGVESEIQVQALRLIGCGLMQGYYYSAPMAHDDLPFLKLSGQNALETIIPSTNELRALVR